MTLRWFTAKRSGAAGHCVEAAFFTPGRCADAACVEVGFAKAGKSANGLDCVEVGFTKADASATNATCVEIGIGGTGRISSTCSCDQVRIGTTVVPNVNPTDVFVRDTKDRDVPDEERTMLVFSAEDWTRYITSLKRGYGAIYNGDDFIIYKDTKFLVYTLAEWEAFMDGVWKGEFDLPADEGYAVTKANTGAPIYQNT